MIVLRFSKFVLLVIITLTLAISCKSKKHLKSESNINSLEEVLGKGWQCYAAPDEFKKAGIVLEYTKDKLYVFDSDYSDKSISGNSAIGSINYSLNTNYGGVLQLLQGLSLFSPDSNISANLSRNTIVSVNYKNTKKHVISGITAQTIAFDYSKRKLVPTSRYFLIRESQSALDLNIEIEKSVLDTLFGSIEVAKFAKASSNKFSEGKNSYVLKNEYKQALGICTLVTELDIKRGATGIQKVTLSNNPHYIPHEINISKK
ncbi:MAG: hypothetical protein AAGA77_05265 [Bacteroidota bacterium]